MSKEEELKALLREAFVLLASGFRPYSDESDKEFAKTLSRIRQAAYAVEKSVFVASQRIRRAMGCVGIVTENWNAAHERRAAATRRQPYPAHRAVEGTDRQNPPAGAAIQS